MAPVRCAGAFPEPGAASLPRPVSTSRAKSSLRRLRPGGEGTGAQRLARARRSVPAGAGKVSIAPRRNGRGWWGYAPACCGRLCQSVPSPTLAVRRLVVTKDGSPTRRPAALIELPCPASSTSPQVVGKGVLACRWSVGLARVRAQTGAAVMREMPSWPCLRSGQAARASLACRESWRGRGCALGFMAATFQRKQFPRRCAASSRDKFFSLPGSPLRCDRKRCGPPIPAGRITTRTHWRDLVQPERRKHHG